MPEFLVKIYLRHMRRSKYFRNTGDKDPQTAIKMIFLKDFDLTFHGYILQNTPEKTVIFTEFIFSRWILKNNVLTRFIHTLF